MYIVQMLNVESLYVKSLSYINVILNTINVDKFPLSGIFNRNHKREQSFLFQQPN